MKPHVIVVEDDVQNALVFRRVLEKRGGFRVTVTEDAAEVARLARADARLIVMDVSLAHTAWEGCPVNGVELCRILKQDPETAAVPVLLATAHAMRGDAERLLVESGADGYVPKPVVDHAAFVDQVRALLKEAA